MSDSKTASVNINRAMLEELVSIRGIGPGLGQGIIDNRPYKSLDELVRVPGINENKLASLKPFIGLGEAKPKRTSTRQTDPGKPEPVAKLGDTEAFVFFENRNERQDALLIVFGGFILGLIILMLRRSSR